MTKLCINCKHFVRSDHSFVPDRCYNPLYTSTNLVYGNVIAAQAATMRQMQDKCSFTGKGFEEKLVEKKIQWYDRFFKTKE